MQIAKRSLVILAAAVLAPISATAGPIVTGDVVFLGSSAGLNLDNNQTESDSLLLYFEKSTTLASAVAVDLAAPGFTAAGAIPLGTSVSSYLLHFDPVADYPSGTYITKSGTITFNAPILGVIIYGAGLAASDGTLGTASEYYDQTTRGLEIGGDVPPYDFLSFAGDQLTINLESLSAGPVIDEVRIITAVPDGGATLALLGLAVGALGLASRYRASRHD